MHQGILKKVNGDEYAGDFKDDLYDGYSLYKYAIGDSYCGDFVLGKRHGNGVLIISATGENFAGRFENDELIGGQVLCQEGEYMGEFAPKTRAFQGRGIMKFKTGDIYDGFWEDGLMHGHGNIIYATLFDDDEDDSDEEEKKEEKNTKVTSMFVGEFCKGKRREGTLTYENGDEYTGNFDENGLRASGSIKFLNGDEFAGLFEEGAMKCGIMTFKSGDVYSGEFMDSMFHGSGKMLFANGDEYSGEFEKGAKHGSGQLIIAIKGEGQSSAIAAEEEQPSQSESQDELQQVAKSAFKILEKAQKETGEEDEVKENMGVYVGEFQNDEMHGNGTFTFPDGSEYIGEFENGL